jgi:DNA-binding NarL/FixJ family response regulator
MTEQVRVLLIDDHAVVREGVRAVLEDFSDVLVVGEAASAADALTLVVALQPQVIISDLKMPGMPVLEAIAALRALLPSVQVVVFSSFADAPQVRAVLQAGAIGYLTKDALSAELHQAILAASKGVPCVHASVRAMLRDARENPHETEALARLTPRERDVLRQIAKAQSNKEIGRDLQLTEGTVKSYVRSIFEKLNVSDRTQAALIALRTGLVDG